LSGSESDTIRKVGCGGFRELYGGSKISTKKNKIFEYSDFEFPHVLIVVLLKYAVFRDIFKDSGQQIDLQLLKLWILIELSPRIILKL
jgi:hypothetical protein